jgi:hypothetical protein
MGGAAGPLTAKAQMHVGTLGYVAGVTIDKLLKNLRRFAVILFLKGSYSNFEILDSGLVLTSHAPSFSILGGYPFKRRFGCPSGCRSACFAMTRSDIGSGGAASLTTSTAQPGGRLLQSCHRMSL